MEHVFGMSFINNHSIVLYGHSYVAMVDFNKVSTEETKKGNKQATHCELALCSSIIIIRMLPIQAIFQSLRNTSLC
jgi:hypothetical protein